MKIKVLFFSKAEKIIGTRKVELEFNGKNLYDLRLTIENLYPGMRGVLETSMFAVNNEYRPLLTHINEGDEIVIIPPVEGG